VPTESLTAVELRPLRTIAAAAAGLLRAMSERSSLARRSDVELAGAGGTTAANAALVRAFLLRQGMARLRSDGTAELIASAVRLKSIAERLRGLADAAELDAGPPTVEAVVTLPSASRLAATLGGRLDAHSTRDGFTHVATHAKERLALLVPFGDAEGAELLVQMLCSTPAPVRLVFVRPDSQGRRWYEPFRVKLTASGARILEYWMPNPTGRPETFHGKVALADDNLAYVGSSNFMTSSLEGGLECGVIPRGDLVRPWSILVNSLDQVCSQRQQ
jgi:hypothetical protein